MKESIYAGHFLLMLILLSISTSQLRASNSNNEEYITVKYQSDKMKKLDKNKDTIQINLADYERSNWTDLEKGNVELMIDFVQKLMNDHDFEYVKDKFDSHQYIQHNRSMNDGMAGVIEYVSDLVKRYPDYTYDVKHIYVDGDFVIFHSHSTIRRKHRNKPDKGVNIFDTWKIKDGLIIEHWDSIQAVDGSMRMFALLTGGKKRNANTLY